MSGTDGFLIFFLIFPFSHQKQPSGEKFAHGDKDFWGSRGQCGAGDDDGQERGADITTCQAWCGAVRERGNGAHWSPPQ